ncbi:MAG: hypothetical protein A2X28_07010 [Elusimicrobia bacterium GWA2_56_46]|nr:MAG: hypothetical protein A2X28_07010 [Elusimicrobia bacterium GWA2_56_46]OGR54802.1 MAG: hypothetical protein A2X39_10980 [Elusimicrobia bacterium GWC2_56_31]HBB67942.1 hypothetical protein [Elusimicrobiota bacterium]HBW23407.1 hypothetical protein [Elusimicrobiota bacterium]
MTESPLKDLLRHSLGKITSRAFGRFDPQSVQGGGRRAVESRVLSGWLAPAGLLAVFIFIAAYALFTRNRGAAPGLFPRSSAEFMEAGRLDRRLAGLAERTGKDPNDIQAFFESGLLKFQKGAASYIEAISDLETARSRGLADIRTFYYLGRMYQAEGLYDFALEEYRRFLNNRPGDFEVRMLAGKLLFSLGRYAQAVKEYEILKDAQPENFLVLENLALSRWKNKQDPQPVIDLLRGMGAEAVFRAGYVSGLVAYESRDYAAAVPLLERAAGESTRYPEFSDLAGIYRMLSDSYVKLKSEAKAVSALGELLKINPSDDEARSLLARLSRAQRRGAPKAQSGKGAK